MVIFNSKPLNYQRVWFAAHPKMSIGSGFATASGETSIKVVGWENGTSQRWIAHKQLFVCCCCCCCCNGFVVIRCLHLCFLTRPFVGQALCFSGLEATNRLLNDSLFEPWPQAYAQAVAAVPAQLCGPQISRVIGPQGQKWRPNVSSLDSNENGIIFCPRNGGFCYEFLASSNRLRPGILMVPGHYKNHPTRPKRHFPNLVFFFLAEMFPPLEPIFCSIFPC